jgi:hypothetical protein
MIIETELESSLFGSYGAALAHLHPMGATLRAAAGAS